MPAIDSLNEHLARRRAVRDACVVTLTQRARQYELPVDAEICPPDMLHAQRDFYRAQQQYTDLVRRTSAPASVQVLVRQQIVTPPAPPVYLLPPPAARRAAPRVDPYLAIALIVVAIVIYAALALSVGVYVPR